MSETTAIPSSIAIAAPDQALLLSSSTKLLDDARAIVIDSNDMLEIANDELGAIKTKWKTLESQRDSLVRPLNDVVKGINALFKGPMNNLVQGEDIIKKAMLTYTTEQERIAQVERDRLAREAENRRQDALRAEREAQELLNATAESGTDEEVEAAQALVMEAQQTTAIAQAPVHYVSAAPKLSGTSVRKVWKARLPQNDAEKIALLKFITANPQYLHLVDVSQSECNKLATAMKSNLKVDGIAAYEDSGITARAR